MWPVFNIQFGSIDDHEILDIIGRRPRLPIGQVLPEIVSRSNEQIGRFRPVYWVGRVLEAAVVGRHSDYWFVNRVFLAVITLAAVYSVAKRYMGPLAAAAVSLLPFLGGQFETWRRLGPNETYAVPLLCLGIALLVDGHAKSKSPSRSWPAYVFLTLAGGAKENFLFVTIFLFAASAWIYGIRRLKGIDWFTLGLTVSVWSINSLFVFFKVRQYGSIYEGSRTVESAKVYFRYAKTEQISWQSVVPGTILLFVSVAATFRAGSLRKTVPLLLFTAALSTVQVLFYAGSPLTGRYLYPICFVPVVIWGVAAASSRQFFLAQSWPTLPFKIGRGAAAMIVPLLLLVPIKRGIDYARGTSLTSARENQNFQAGLAQVRSAAKASNATSIVIQPSEPWSDMERTLALSRYLFVQNDIPVMTLPMSNPGDGAMLELSKQVEVWSTKGRKPMVPYVPDDHCLSVVFGANKPVCPTSVPSAG